MSTKTLRKRIALVAVAALGFGLLSVAPSSAARSSQADSLTLSATTSTGTVGTAVTAITVTQTLLAGGTINQNDSITVTASFVSVPPGATVAEVPQFTWSAGTNATPNVVNGGSTGINYFSVAPTAASLFTSGAATATFTPTKAGTYIIKFTPKSAPTDTETINSTAQTWTVTVAAKGAVTAADSTSFIKSGTAWTTITADDSIAVSSTTNTEVAVINVTSKNAALTDLSAETILTAVVTSGPGTLGIGSTTDGAASTGRAITGTAGQRYISVWSDGTAGVSLITISAGTTVLATETVTFYGALATLTATVAIAQIPLSVATAAVVTVVGKDASGNVVVVTPTVTSATAASIASGTCTASTATTASSCTLTAGATAGSSVLTFTSGTITTTATVAAAAAPTKVVVAFDKATYVPGEAFTLTLTASNAAGVPADKVYAALLAAALTPSSSITSTLFGPSVTIKNGVATATGFMPVVSGPFSVTGKTGADATTADVVVSASATIGVSADAAAAAEAIAAAADAAAEATDAANAATDAANAAAEAADAATAAAQDAADAIAALSVEVGELIADLSAQITAQKAAIRALTNLVIKIQKAVAKKK